MRILFVAPSSYPIFGAEANVNAKMLNALTEGGAIVDLVCRAVRANRTCYPESTTDFFFKKVNSINLVKVDTNFDFSTILRHLKTFLKTGYIYKGIDWAFDAISVCENLIKQYQYDYIYTYDYPSEVVGAYIARKYKIRWVATWNDPYMWIKYPYPYGKGPDTRISYFRKKLISDIGKYTFYNVFPSARLRDYMLQYMVGMDRNRSLISPHIIIEKFIPSELPAKNDEVLKIIHAGALGRERNPEILLKGIRSFLDKVTDAKIEITFLGVLERMHNNAFFEQIEALHLDKWIKCLPPVSYMESLSVMKQYDLCLLLEAPCEEGIFLPSKISDYMQNRKTIWAISPVSGVLHDMYVDGKIDYFSDVKSVEDISSTLYNIYTDYQSERLHCPKNVCECFLSKNVYSQHLRYILNNQ